MGPQQCLFLPPLFSPRDSPRSSYLKRGAGVQSGGGTKIRLALTHYPVSCCYQKRLPPACGDQLLNGCLGRLRGGRWGLGGGWPLPLRAFFLLALPFPGQHQAGAQVQRRACISRSSPAVAPLLPSFLTPHCSSCWSSPAGRTDLPRRGDRAGVRIEGWGLGKGQGLV